MRAGSSVRLARAVSFIREADVCFRVLYAKPSSFFPPPSLQPRSPGVVIDAKAVLALRNALAKHPGTRSGQFARRNARAGYATQCAVLVPEPMVRSDLQLRVLHAVAIGEGRWIAAPGTS